MKRKSLYLLLAIFILLTAYLLATQNNLGGIFRTPTPTSTNTFTPTPTNTSTPTPTETLSWSFLDNDGDGVLNYADNCPNKYAETSNGCPQNSGSDGNGTGPPGDWNDQ